MAMNYKLIKKEYRFQHTQENLNAMKKCIDKVSEFQKSDEFKKNTPAAKNYKLKHKFNIYFYNGDLRNILKLVTKFQLFASDTLSDMSDGVQIGKVRENNYLEICALYQKRFKFIRERCEYEYDNYFKK